MKLAIQASPDVEVPFVWFWPQGKKTAVVMSHDVEDKLGADACEMLMDIDSSFNIKAAFHFIPETRYPERFESLVSRARARGFEANIHDLDHDGRLFVNEKQFTQRAQRINEYARKFKAECFRAGSMHRNQDWIERLDFQYDMSVPNVAHLEPQKGGCCTVMPYFLGQTVEMPLTTIQDYALFKILHDHSIDLWKQQIQDIAARHGLISFIIHPDYIIEKREKQLYCDLLAYLSNVANEQNFWMAFPSEINRWWRERNEMTLVREGNDWVVTGAGSERALVAYASLIQGKLTYRIGNEVSTTLA